MGSILTLEFIAKNRKTIAAFFLTLVTYILFFTIERMSDRIDSLKAEIETKSAEIAVLQAELHEVSIDTEKVKKYFEKLNAVNNTEKQELETNENLCQTSADFNSIVPRLNELFGFCSE